MEPLAVGARVERVNSPAGSLLKDGVRGVVREILQCANGDLGYLVRLEGFPPDAGIFCAGTRLRAVSAADSAAGR
jgi:hypothetical protein